MTCSKCECLVRVKNKLGYNLYYCGYKKYGVLKALSGLYINNEEYRKDNKTCKYYKGENKGRKEMTDEEKAKEITMKYFDINEHCFERLLQNKDFVYNFYKGVLKGLAEARKQLEKENEKK